MKTETTFKKVQKKIVVTLKVEELDSTIELSSDEAQELLLQLVDVLMEVQGRVQTGRPSSGRVPEKFIIGSASK